MPTQLIVCNKGRESFIRMEAVARKSKVDIVFRHSNDHLKYNKIDLTLKFTSNKVWMCCIFAVHLEYENIALVIIVRFHVIGFGEF